ncbi:hypothetical protein L596_008756 [Steinernema carpocapsae]|uniref:Carboxylesterase type B domain-containing protein n=1 Tax=Steinernema carpocapsae TaxID=34508 RepID=A0A4U5PDN5_STECR|nr:hypothetical protein L596_008756 [Steinernema carpocapsae]
MQKDLLSGFISFAKSGTPVVSGKKWKPITKHHPDRYMSFSPSSHMKNGYMKEAIDFWTKVACTTANQNMIRKSLLPTLEC